MKLRREKPPIPRSAGVLGVRRLARGRARGAPSARPDRPQRARPPHAEPDRRGASGPDARAAGAAAPREAAEPARGKGIKDPATQPTRSNRCLQFADHSGQGRGSALSPSRGAWPAWAPPCPAPRGVACTRPTPHRGGRAAEWTSVRGGKLDRNKFEPAGAGFAFSKPWEDARLCLFFIALVDFCGWVF